MSLFSKLRGTIETIFQIGLGGPQWKANAQALEARNPTDTGFAIVRGGAPPIAPSDLTPKAFVAPLFESGKLGSAVVIQDVAWDVPIGGPPTANSQGRDGLMISFHVPTNRYWLFGGWNPVIWGALVQTNNELWSSPDGFTWTLVQPNLANPPQAGPTARPRQRHGGQLFPHVCQDGVTRLVMICADIQDISFWQIAVPADVNGYQADVWTWDGAIWVPKTLAAPWALGVGGVWGQIAFSIPGGGSGGGSTLFVCGGQSTQGFASVTNAVWKSVDDGVTWIAVAAAPWVGRSQAPCAQTLGFGTGSEIVLACGGGYDGAAGLETPQKDVWSFDGTTWTRLTADFGGPSRIYSNVIWWPAGQMLVMADGFQGGPGGVGNLNDVWTSTDGVTWTRQWVVPWGITHADSLVTSPTSLAVYRQGGIQGNNADMVKVQSLSETIHSTQTLSVEQGITEYAKFAAIGGQRGPAARFAVLNFADINPAGFPGGIVPLVGANSGGTTFPLLGFDGADLWVGDAIENNTAVIMTGRFVFLETFNVGEAVAAYSGGGGNNIWFASGNPCNLGFFSGAIAYGGGTGCLGLFDASTIPTGSPSSGLIYSDGAAGAMRTRGKGSLVVGIGGHGVTTSFTVAEIDAYNNTVSLNGIAPGGTASVSIALSANEAWKIDASVDSVELNAMYHRRAQARVRSNGVPVAAFASVAIGSLANPTNSFAATEVEVCDAPFHTGALESTNVFTVVGASVVLTVTNNGASPESFLVQLAHTRLKA